MIALLIIGGYFLGWMLTSAVILRQLALGYDDPAQIDLEEVFLATFMGVFWPVTAPMGLIYLWAKRPTKEQRRKVAADRIRQLEREAGL